MIQKFKDYFSTNEQYNDHKIEDSNTDNKKSINTIADMLDEIRQYKDLRKFQFEMGNDFCNKHKIKQTQLNFLISIIGAERAKESGMFG